MEFKIVDKIKDAGNGKWNEDELIIMSDCVAVIDGSTSIKNTKFKEYDTYAEWFVQEFKKIFLLRYKAECNITSFVKQCVDTIQYKTPLFDIPFYEKPTFTLSVIQIVKKSLICYTIGDCSIYVFKKNGNTEYIYDKRVDQFSNKTLLKQQYAKKNNLDVDSYIRDTRIDNLHHRNKTNGFWVIGYDGNYENEFVKREFDIQEIESLLICSDGFNRAFKEFSLINPINIFKDKISLMQVLTAIREYEELNHAAYDFPCVKKSDDATAALLSLSTAH
ncbi:protein phosphatase 2C domain-containing protein [Bacteroides sp.]